MNQPDVWADRVACAALLMSIACFLAFAIETIVRLVRMNTSSAAAAKATKDVGIRAQGASAEQASKLLEAAAKLVDSFNKATPGVVALVASMVFLSIAAYVVKPAAPTTQQTTPSNSTKS